MNIEDLGGLHQQNVDFSPQKVGIHAQNAGTNKNLGSKPASTHRKKN